MDQEQGEVSEWTAEQAMARFDASQPARTRKRPRDLNKLAASLVRDAVVEDDDKATTPRIKFEPSLVSTFHGVRLADGSISVRGASLKIS